MCTLFEDMFECFGEMCIMDYWYHDFESREMTLNKLKIEVQHPQNSKSRGTTSGFNPI